VVFSLLEGGVGALIVLTVLVDVFQSIVTPRPTAGRLRSSRYVLRGLWLACRWFALRMRSVSRRDALLGSFGPFSVVAMLVSWVLLLLLGYGLLLDSMSDQIKPQPPGFLSTLYFAATSMLTIGYGDYVPTRLPARVVSMLAGATGLGMFALVITFLYNVTQAFQRREVLVVSLEAGAGAPPSGVTLLETYAVAGLDGDLAAVFQRWQEWAAEVLDSHLSYPPLAFFRSSHDNDSWISSLGAVMDAATLVLTTLEVDEANESPSGPMLPRRVRGWAKLARSVGGHCIEDLVLYYGLLDERQVGVEFDEFCQARERLARAGYRVRPETEAWEAFRRYRSEYAGRMNSIAIFWASPPAQWIGDRSPLKQRARHDGSLSSSAPPPPL
jgi:hypothetical protein